MSLLSTVSRVLFVHAHPDDETIVTGALIASLRSRDVDVRLVTATRGESGEVRPGVLPEAATAEQFVAHREAELSAACEALDISQHAFLGTPPASVDGVQRRYRDSGMVWVTPGVAGPDPTAPSSSFSRIDPALPTADLQALVDAWQPELLLTYDDHGGYGHPDHLRARQICLVLPQIPVVEFIVGPNIPADAETLSLELHRSQALQALSCYPSQLTLLDDHTIEHVGGQTEPVHVTVGLRKVRP